MALARCPERHGQRSFRRMCQVSAGRWRARRRIVAACARLASSARRACSVPGTGKDVVTGAEVALVGQLNRDELYMNLGCLRKCVQVAGI
jgi:hypothetical protein